jgi:hypothetical protein
MLSAKNRYNKPESALLAANHFVDLRTARGYPISLPLKKERM